MKNMKMSNKFLKNHEISDDKLLEIIEEDEYNYCINFGDGEKQFNELIKDNEYILLLLDQYRKEIEKGSLQINRK